MTMTSRDTTRAAELERELLATLTAAAERHGDRHEEIMELLSAPRGHRSAGEIDWEAWDSLTALQDADWLIIDGAQKQLRALGHVPA